MAATICPVLMAPGFQAELLSDGNTDRRSYLYHDLLSRVAQRSPYLLDLWPDAQSTRRAYRHALAAVDTVDFAQPAIVGRGHFGPRSAIGEVDGANTLYFSTHPHTISTQYAPVVVTYQARCGKIQGDFALPGRETYLTHAEARTKFLEFAHPVLDTRRAISVVIGQQQFHSNLRNATLFHSVIGERQQKALRVKGGPLRYPASSDATYGKGKHRSFYHEQAHNAPDRR
jgi:hypothetical protein